MAHGDALPEESTTPEARQMWRDCFDAWQRWKPASEAPKDGTHILACRGPYRATWGFTQSPPAVVHYWSNPGEEGFYLSHGLVEGSYNDVPFEFTHWRSLGAEPR